MEENPGTMPSATSIIEAAEVNKSTFYYHYESVQDLISQINQDLFDTVMEDALANIDRLTCDPEQFLRDFCNFAYREPSGAFAGNAHLKTTTFDSLIASIDESAATGFDSRVVEVVLLGLWGYSRRVDRLAFERSIPALAAFIESGRNKMPAASPR